MIFLNGRFIKDGKFKKDKDLKQVKVRSRLYKEHKLVCKTCGKKSETKVGIDPERGHKPFDPDGRHIFYCSDKCTPKQMIANAGPTKEEIERQIAIQYIEKHLTEEQKLEVYAKAIAESKKSEETKKAENGESIADNMMNSEKRKPFSDL